MKTKLYKDYFATYTIGNTKKLQERKKENIYIF